MLIKCHSQLLIQTLCQLYKRNDSDPEPHTRRVCIDEAPMLLPDRVPAHQSTGKQDVEAFSSLFWISLDDPSAHLLHRPLTSVFADFSQSQVESCRKSPVRREPLKCVFPFVDVQCDRVPVDQYAPHRGGSPASDGPEVRRYRRDGQPQTPHGPRGRIQHKPERTTGNSSFLMRGRNDKLSPRCFCLLIWTWISVRR